MKRYLYYTISVISLAFIFLSFYQIGKINGHNIGYKAGLEEVSQVKKVCRQREQKTIEYCDKEAKLWVRKFDRAFTMFKDCNRDLALISELGNYNITCQEKVCRLNRGAE